MIKLAIFYELVHKNVSGLNSIVYFTLKVLRHCLRYINFKELAPKIDLKNKAKEKELFRYLHLIVDLSSNPKNHIIMMHPMMIRNILYFIMNTDSENLLHYHRIFDCKIRSSDIINMTRKNYFLEYFSIDFIIGCLNHLRRKKHDLFVRFGPIIYLHCVGYNEPANQHEAISDRVEARRDLAANRGHPD